MEQLNREVFKYREDQGILPPESYIADIKKNLEGWVRLGNLKYRARWISPEATDDEVLAYTEKQYRSSLLSDGYVVLRLRAYPNNPLYPQGKPDACDVGQKCSQRGENHASEHFWPAALASNFSLGLITTRLFG
ncbi:MAG: hypothetical protein ACYSUB_16170 [Planctomycetota bacterium]